MAGGQRLPRTKNWTITAEEVIQMTGITRNIRRFQQSWHQLTESDLAEKWPTSHLSPFFKRLPTCTEKNR